MVLGGCELGYVLAVDQEFVSEVDEDGSNGGCLLEEAVLYLVVHFTVDFEQLLE